MAFIYRVRSDKDDHFTGEILQNAAEEENIEVPQALQGMNGTVRAIVRAVNIISDENLAWELWFFQNDLFQESNLDNDRFTGKYTFAAADAVRIGGTGAYYYYKDTLAIPYEDLDKTGELHVALVNRSAGAKTAGAAGEVVVEFTLEQVNDF